MEQKDMNLEQVNEEQLPAPEKPEFIPSPKWKRIVAWILFAIVVLGTINWLISIAFPTWPQWLMEQFR